jgi:multiple sugar transport system permease protein
MQSYTQRMGIILLDKYKGMSAPMSASEYDSDRRTLWHRYPMVPYFFLLPYLVAFVLLRFGPTLAGLGISFLKWDIMGQPHVVGLRNYAELARDPQFFLSFKNTLYFMLLTAPALVILGLVLALLVDQRLRGRMVARTVVFTPYVVMSTVVGVIWLWIYNKDVGILNYYLGFLGIGKIAWLSSTVAAMPAVSIATLWWSVGFNMIIFLAGLQDIPQELEEAARVDGATELGVLRYITLPLLAPTTFVVVMLTLINTIQVFDQIYVMTGGGPSLSTLTLIQYLYYQAFQFFKLGYGSAVAYVVLVVLILMALVQRRLLPEE